jgi:hypothetical protein
LAPLRNEEFSEGFSCQTLSGNSDVVRTAGPVSNSNGTLSVNQIARGGIWTWLSCQRALTVANNVATDVLTSTQNRSESQSSAVDVAHRIAAKIPQ